MSQEGKIIGTDLGTSNTEVANLTKSGLEIVENKEGDKLTPSVLYAPTMDSIVVGSRAKHMMLAKSDYCISRWKPGMNVDPKSHIFTHPDSGDTLTPVEANSHVIRYTISCFEDYYQIKVKGAVIGVPARFGQEAIEATKEAGRLAGLEKVEIRREPTMGIRAQFYTNPDRIPRGLVGVFDVGGGTFDLTICEVGNTIRVIATDGSHILGGDDFTIPIYNFIREQFKEEHGIEFDSANAEHSAYLQDLWDKAERLKLDVSSGELQDSMTSVMAEGQAVSLEMSTDQFEDLNSDNAEKVREKAASAIEQAEISTGDLSCILLIGGASRMRCISKVAEEVTGGDVPILAGTERDLAVAQGCAIEAAKVGGEPTHNIPLLAREIEDVTSFSIGVACCRRGETDPDRMVVYQLIPENTPLSEAEASREFGLAVPGGASQGAKVDAGFLIVTEGDHQQEYRPELEIQRFSLEGIEPGDSPDDKQVRISVSVEQSGIARMRCVELATGVEIENELDRKLKQGGK